MLSAELTRPWYASPYAGLFREFGPAPRTAYDPDVCVWSGVAPLPDAGADPPASGGAAWDMGAAESAGVGEAIERWQAWPLPGDGSIEASVANWPLDEPAIGPDQWVLFHPEQYALPGFPYVPFTKDTVCRWVAARDVRSGLPAWVPEELVYLTLPPGRSARLCPLISSGLVCGWWGQQVLLRGLQEAIERDAVVGASWGRYPLVEHDSERVFAVLGRDLAARLRRPNLRYRFFRIETPFSSHVTVVTLEGEDRAGWVFSVGAACRETRPASWTKAVLEAVQGRHYVRYLKGRHTGPLDVPANFAEHALYYSVHPRRLDETPLRQAIPATDDPDADRTETLSGLIDRLGPERPVLFRNLTPPGIAIERLGWYVLRVVVPGLQPLHGHHALPFLGGPLWAPRGWKDWANMPPHPFP